MIRIAFADLSAQNYHFTSGADPAALTALTDRHIY
jgi:hypothetical protein